MSRGIDVRVFPAQCVFVGGEAGVIQAVGKEENVTFMRDLGEDDTRAMNILRVVVRELAPGVGDFNVGRKFGDRFQIKNEVESFQELFVVKMFVGGDRGMWSERGCGEVDIAIVTINWLRWWSSNKFDSIRGAEWLVLRYSRCFNYRKFDEL